MIKIKFLFFVLLDFFIVMGMGRKIGYMWRRYIFIFFVVVYGGEKITINEIYRVFILK